MPVISVTRLRLRSWRYFLSFVFHAQRSATQARRADGNLGVDLLREAGNIFWTRTAWRDRDAMRAFMTSGAHRLAMPKLLEMCDEASLVHWDQPGEALPSWPDAHQRLLKDGRRSKVNHPSAAHESFAIPPPKVT